MGNYLHGTTRRARILCCCWWWCGLATRSLCATQTPAFFSTCRGRGRSAAVGCIRRGKQQQQQQQETYHHRQWQPVENLSFHHHQSSCSLLNGCEDSMGSSGCTDSCSSYKNQRRRFLVSTHGLFVVGPAALMSHDVCMPSRAVAASSSNILIEADSTQTVGGGAAAESLRRSSPNIIPGLGPADVFYPESFVGSWNMSRQVVLSEDNALTLNYPIRFLSSVDAKTGQAAAVADRGFNQAALENALRVASLKLSSTTSTTTGSTANVVQSYTWSASNPNDLRIYFTNGSSKEIKVTKRAASIVESENATTTTATIESSEFQRVTLDDQTVPVISARRVLTKWKVVDGGSLVEGLELVYDMGYGGTSDSLAFATQQPQQQQQPKLLSKSRLRITRHVRS